MRPMLLGAAFVQSYWLSLISCVVSIGNRSGGGSKQLKGLSC